MTKVTLLGAGSGFTQTLFTDILSIADLGPITIGLVDIDAQRLNVNIKLMHRLLQVLDKTNCKIEASTDRKEVLKGSDYIISTIEVSGTKCVRWDNDIPMQYGIDQCIGDTIGPGGIMKALRTLPPFLDILTDIQKYCPNALVMNYTNPMSIMSLASTRFCDLPYVGLCHSVQGTSAHLANILEIPYEKMKWRCGGINHMAWFTELTYKGKDLYPKLLQAMQDKETYERDPVRFEMMQQFGYFVTESSGHFSEYVPYFRKNKKVMKQYCRPSYLGGSSFYADSWPQWRKETDKKRRDMASGKIEIPTGTSHEYASQIIKAHKFNQQETIYASVPNTGLIPNLPNTGVVEVAVLVDQNGYTPTYFGNLPEQVAALCRSNMAVYELTAQGVLNKDREAIVHAMMLDPLSAAVCCPAEIREMADKLFRAEKNYIPLWCNKPAKKIAAPTKKRHKTTKKIKDGAAQVSSMAARNVK
ncbi:MAG: alpha-galactosidase [Sedimentisphaerales bacterium]|nr:alpha-galactosidase [Sedimentisphaerales bacterium]